MAATRIPRSRETTKRMTTPSDHPSRAHPRVIDVQTHYVPPAAARLLHDVRVAGIADALEPNSAICTLDARSEEHTSELQSLMRISYAVFCLKKKKKTNYINTNNKNRTTNS